MAFSSKFSIKKPEHNFGSQHIHGLSVKQLIHQTSNKPPLQTLKEQKQSKQDLEQAVDISSITPSTSNHMYNPFHSLPQVIKIQSLESLGITEGKKNLFILLQQVKS